VWTLGAVGGEEHVDGRVGEGVEFVRRRRLIISDEQRPVYRIQRTSAAKCFAASRGFSTRSNPCSAKRQPA
jgi:hypothetical protein